MYKTESHFKHAVISRLNKANAFVTNIESHGTGVGIPDTYVCGAGYDCWLEFKNDSDQYISNKKFKVPYRPGQLAWHDEYHFRTTKYVVTLMSVADGVLLLRGSGRLAQIMVSSSNKISEEYKHLYKITDEDWRKLNINRLLKIMSNRLKIPNNVKRDGMTSRDMVNHWMDTYFSFEDYDPEAVWNDPATIDSSFDRDLFDSKEYEMLCNCKFGL